MVLLLDAFDREFTAIWCISCHGIEMMPSFIAQNLSPSEGVDLFRSFRRIDTYRKERFPWKKMI